MHNCCAADPQNLRNWNSVPIEQKLLETLYPLNKNSYLPLPVQFLVTTIMFSISQSLTPSGTSCNYTAFVLCNWLLSLSRVPSRFIHVVACIRISFFFFFFFFNAGCYSIISVYPFLFIYAYINGHLSCFHLLAIASNAWLLQVINMGVQISLQGSVLNSFGEIYPEVELLYHIVILCLSFQEPVYSFP